MVNEITGGRDRVEQDCSGRGKGSRIGGERIEDGEEDERSIAENGGSGEECESERRL